jgi:carboxypeptidase family protein
MSNAACPRSGAATGRILLVWIAFVFLAGLAWLWLVPHERTGRTRGPESEPAPVADPAERPSTELLPAARQPSEAPRTSGDREGELEPFRGAGGEDKRFLGKTGSVRGHVEVEGELAFPETWRVVARPSTLLAAREFAVGRTVEIHGSQDFELRELPLGGYDLFGEAEGFNGQVLPLLLEPGSEHPFVNLRMVPAGTLEGRVLDALGGPAEDVPITLFAVADNAAREARSGPDGVYRFEKLPDGAYDLLVGIATSPILPERRPVRFLAPRLTFPDIELPTLGEIHLRTVDSLERPVEGVIVRGSGTNGGLVDGRTDALGWLVARYLPAGHYRLRLEHPAYDAKASRRVAVEVKVGEITKAPVLFGN